ncbi:hypothetical protein SK128_028050 [Halocaridina rubra]|uniref:Uncharacterized protein n=1 Tax=Halocaridina rubra TaxID=373956 RepID=A0AAN8WU30_HALRR
MSILNQKFEKTTSPEKDKSHEFSDKFINKYAYMRKPDEMAIMKKNIQEKPPDTENLSEGEAKPPDGGWGWMVAIGCFLITSLIPMVAPCFGILFSRYLLDLGTSSTTTAWIFNSQCFIWNAMGLFTRPLTQEFGWRKIGMLGALLASISMIMSAFAPSAEFLYFSFSLLSGTGGGAVTCICFTILPNYFDRHKGVANAMMMAGVCLGQIICPPLIQLLQDEYGFRGATMIVGAIILNGCIGASFFHPIAWHWIKSEKYKPQSIPEVKISLLSSDVNKHEKSNGFNVSHSSASLGGLKESFSSKSLKDYAGKETDWTEIMTQARLLRRRQSRHISEMSQVSVSSSFAVSTMDIFGIGAGYAEKEVSETSSSSEQVNGGSICNIVTRVAKSTLSDLKVLKSPRALIIALGATFCLNGYVNFIMMVPFAMQMAGYSLEFSAWCVSISAICNLLMRLLVSGLSDWPKFNVKACYMTGFAIIFLSTLVFPFLTDQRWIMVVMGIWGCGVGTTMGVYNIVMITVMGLDNLAPVFGASCFMVAVGFITFGPLIGVVRDVSQSYYVSMWMVSGMLLTSFILWLFMPAAEAYDERRAKAKQNENKRIRTLGATADVVCLASLGHDVLIGRAYDVKCCQVNPSKFRLYRAHKLAIKWLNSR